MNLSKAFDEYMQQWPDANGPQQLFIEQVFLGGVIAASVMCLTDTPAQVNKAACSRALELVGQARQLHAQSQNSTPSKPSSSQPASDPGAGSP